MIPLFRRADDFSERPALISNKKTYTYADLTRHSNRIAAHLLKSKTDLAEARIAFLVPPSFEYTAVQWGVWKAGGVAVPLCDLHPLPALQYVLEDTGAEVVIFHPDYEARLSPLFEKLPARFVRLTELDAPAEAPLPDIAPERRAMILYTSGTTSRPKGVVTTHRNIEFQIKSLVEAWQWRPDDHILNVLPLHHVHGIINVMSCALWSGARCTFLPKFDAEKVWEIFATGQLTLFMAVPTIYFKLIQYWESAPEETRKMLSRACSGFRLMVSGSAALPVSVLEKWKHISGHTLLERYGMTEIGMALSNPYDGERRAGSVGRPLPKVQIRLVGENGDLVPAGTPGIIQVKSPGVFLEYWRNPEATQNAFTPDGWFITGDVAVLENGYYRILGRDSVDIIKSGGYKISALEIEEILRRHPGVRECAVVGVPDEAWGEIVAAALIPSDTPPDPEALKAWLKTQLPAYKVPRQFIFLEELPRNTLGKVTKKAITALFGERQGKV
ncbi:MAG: long-chain fatty acid--CoA ligase [Bacteroidetes bacterium]|nr:MAG: long-chain fatty acid--CoA ligase [Bacteroidota bacterium]